MSANMISAGQNSSKRLRAFCAALALLISALSGPLALSGQSSGVCSMTCCVEDGHCCCNPPQDYVEGEGPERQPIITLAELVAPCPDGCTGSQSSSQLRLRSPERAASHHLNVDSSPVAESQQATDSYTSPEWEKSSPRGPPLIAG
jgi:hypothetical protein